MSFLSGLFGLLKKLAIFFLIVAIAIPLRYGSTNPKYLTFRLMHSMLSLKYSLVPDRDRPTLSADYRAFESILRMRPAHQRDPLADGLTLVKEMRLSFGFDSLLPKPSQCQVNKEVFEHDGHTVDTYWVDNRGRNFDRNSDKILLYFHGGGYILGDVHSELSNMLR